MAAEFDPVIRYDLEQLAMTIGIPLPVTMNKRAKNSDIVNHMLDEVRPCINFKPKPAALILTGKKSTEVRAGVLPIEENLIYDDQKMSELGSEVGFYMVINFDWTLKNTS
eukprot:UN26148